VLYIHCSEWDDYLLWNGSEQDGNVINDCEEDDGTDCEDGDSDTECKRLIESGLLCVSVV
jgi:hypothetical protein